MISQFIQKALLKHEKSESILIKDSQIKLEILSGAEISNEFLENIFNKSRLKRKDFTRLEEIIKEDLDIKIREINEKDILQDLISEDFKKYDIPTLKTKLTKSEYVYITGKTLYEHLINKKETPLETIRQNRLLLFLNIPNKDWKDVDNLIFEKYFQIPVTHFFAAFLQNEDHKLKTAVFQFKENLSFAEFSVFDEKSEISIIYRGAGTNFSDFIKFDLSEEIHDLQAVLIFPKPVKQEFAVQIFAAENSVSDFQKYSGIFLKSSGNEQILQNINNTVLKRKVAVYLNSENTPNEFPKFLSERAENQSTYKIIEKLAGKYRCFTIGKDKDRIKLQTVTIQTDGGVQFSSSSLYHDSGYARISDSEKILQIHFHFEADEYKYIFLIHLSDNNIQSGKLQGVVCGINRLNEPFAERVFLVKSNDAELQNHEYLFSNFRFSELVNQIPELLDVFLGKTNDFSVDFKSLEFLNQRFYLPKIQNIAGISGVFNVFMYNILRESIQKLVFRISETGEVLIKSPEKGQNYFGKISISASDLVYISVFKGKSEPVHTGFIVSLSEGFDADGIRNMLAFFTGKNDKNELITSRQVFIKSDIDFENSEPSMIAINSEQFNELNSNFSGVGNYLIGKTGNILKSEFTINHHLRRETDFGQLYFESAYYAAQNQDKTGVLMQLEKAFKHGFRNKSLLLKETENGFLKEFKNWIDVENLKVKEEF
jgi:hypothetical protein